MVYPPSMEWSVAFLDEDVLADMSAMPADIRASFRRIVELIVAVGLERVREPSSGTWKVLSGKCG